MREGSQQATEVARRARPQNKRRPLARNTSKPPFILWARPHEL